VYNSEEIQEAAADILLLEEEFPGFLFPIIRSQSANGGLYYRRWAGLTGGLWYN
jgi:hypothetical protein